MLDKSRKETTRSSKMRELNIATASYGSYASTFNSTKMLENIVEGAIKNKITNFNLTQNRDTPLSDLGADSLTIVEIVSEFLANLNNTLGVYISEDKFTDLATSYGLTFNNLTFNNIIIIIFNRNN
jgi:hypothetical protein